MATIGITFSLQARFADSAPADIAARLGLAALSLLILLCPDERISAAACVPVLLLIGYWLVRRRNTFDVDDGALQPVAVAPAPSSRSLTPSAAGCSSPHAAAARASARMRSTMEKKPFERWGVRCSVRPSSANRALASAPRTSWGVLP